MKDNILIYHHVEHIGGGQTYFNELYKVAKKTSKNVFKLQTDSLLLLLIYIAKKRPRHIVWIIYSGFPFWIYLICRIFGIKNHIVILGFWHQEYIVNIKKDNRYKSKLINVFHDFKKAKLSTKLRIKQLMFFLFSDSVIHLSKFSVSCHSPFIRQLLSKKILIIYGGANKQYFFPIRNRNTLRKKYSLSTKKKLLLMVGRIEPRKNYLDGIKILHKLNKKESKYQLVLVLSIGKFNDYDYLREIFIQKEYMLERENVRIFFGLNKSQINELYNSANAFLMLSKHLETYGLVTREAAETSTPIFGYNSCATLEVITPNSDLLVNPGNINVLVKKIHLFLKKNRTIKYDNNHTWSKAYKKILDHIN